MRGGPYFVGKSEVFLRVKVIIFSFILIIKEIMLIIKSQSI